MPYFVDTNIFLRVLIKENNLSFRESQAFLKLIKNRQITAFTSNMVLAEINWTLSSFYKFPKVRVVRALQSIVNLKGLKIQDKININLSLELYQKHNVKFIDAIIVSHPLIFEKRISVISYDKDFDKLGIKRLEPGQLIKLRGKK